MPYNPEAYYNIDVPGLQDFIRIPPMEDGQLKRERFLRMKQNETERPGWVNKASHVAGLLDDAQDLLYTALILSRPLLKRLPAKFIPGLGWVLLANDIINIVTALFSVAATGPTGKRHSASILEILGSSRKSRVKTAKQFLRKVPWVPAIIQGLQAAETVTGYGVNLGAMMGMVSDVVWTPWAAAQGKKISIKGPPAADIATKAAHFLTASAAVHTPHGVMSDDDWQLVTAASAIAMSELATPETAQKLEQRGPQIANWQLPVREPWAQSTIDAAAATGVDLTVEPAAGPGVDDPLPTVASITASTVDRVRDWELTRRQADGPTSHGTIMQMIHTQAGQDTFDWGNGGSENRQWMPAPIEKMGLWLMENAIVPPAWTTLEQQALFFEALQWEGAWEFQLNHLAGVRAAARVYGSKRFEVVPADLMPTTPRVYRDEWLAPFWALGSKLNTNLIGKVRLIT